RSPRTPFEIIPRLYYTVLPPLHHCPHLRRSGPFSDIPVIPYRTILDFQVYTNSLISSLFDSIDRPTTGLTEKHSTIEDKQLFDRRL
ncbi:Hypothetical predicted protein, partial [Marmota monax]